MLGHRLALLVFFTATLFSCGPSVTLMEADFGVKTQREVGFELEVTHLKGEYARQIPGFHVVNEPVDWLEVWDDGHLKDAHHPLPPDIDFKSQMLLVAVTTHPDTTMIEVDRVIQVKPGSLHVYVNEETLGDKCEPPKKKLDTALKAHANDAAMDVVAIRKTDLPIVLHVDRAKGLSCDPVPKVQLKCNVAGQRNDSPTMVAAQPGDSVECDGTDVKTVVGFIADRNWYFGRPPDSFSKIEIDPKEEHAHFTVDAYGEYKIRMEAVDDRTKRGEMLITTEVAPPENMQVVQVGWNQVTAKDDPAKLPKLEVHLVELGFPLGTAGKDCTETTPQLPWCEVKTFGYARQIRLKAVKGVRYRVVVKYLDDRAPQTPAVCTHSFIRGSTVSFETCDYADRTAGDKWEPGAINPDTGGYEDPNKPHVAPNKPPPPPKRP